MADPGSVTPQELAALLGWWKTSGVDCAVSDVPSPWFGSVISEPEALSARFSQMPPDVSQQIAAVTKSLSVSRPPLPATPETDWSQFKTLADLRAKIAAENPKAPFADGNPESGLLILGEAPSPEDLRTGRPFTGPAGQFLDRMLASIGVNRSKCYISLLCPRKPTPGPPSPEAIEADLALTQAHINLLNPRYILLLGANPVHALTNKDLPISKLRGQWLEVDLHSTAPSRTIPALATFNPAYLLRRPEEKAKAWADLLDLSRRLSA